MSQRSDDARDRGIPWARRWLALAVGCLVLAGFFALFPLLGRMPPFDRWVVDPLFFRRCLVIHVNLALVLWFQAFIAALFSLLPARAASDRRMAAGFALSVAGVALLLVAGLSPGVEPVLSNYVPALDSPLFFAALGCFAAGLAVTFATPRWIGGPERGHLPDAARWGLRAAAFALLVALATFAVSAVATPGGMSAASRCEALFWGGGHVMQFASVAAMLACWLLLLERAGVRAPLQGAAAPALFAALVAPTLAAPWLAAQGTMSVAYRSGSTQLMRWGLFPVTLLVLAACLVALARSARERRGSAWADPRVMGFAASAALALTGFVLGALIRGSSTLVPAHYHASIGAVTTAFTTAALALLAPLGLREPAGRLARAALWQPLLFGGGQLVMVLGFAFAGAHGMGRKLYGAEQASRTFSQSAGLAVMGLGGLVAVAGGVLFLVLVVPAWRRRTAPAEAATWELAWQANASIRGRR